MKLSKIYILHRTLSSNFNLQVIILRTIYKHSQMKSGHSFPGQQNRIAADNKSYGAPYRPDTSKHKQNLITTLKKSESLWTNEQYEESLALLKKAITTIEYISTYQSIQSVRLEYQSKMKQLKLRLKTRESHPKNEISYNRARNQANGSSNRNQDSDNMKRQIGDAILKEMPNVRWDDVAGLENAKNALKEAVILPTRFKQIFVGNRKPWKGILLYGPPGTGKTFLAKACATEAKCTFYSVSSADLTSKYVGQTEKLIKTLFQNARANKPSVIFIDQIDSMCGNRTDGDNDASKRAKTEFLVQMQGVGHDETGVLVLGATNLPWTLDPAIRRRFQRRIYISLPQYEARYGMIKRSMKIDSHSLQQSDFKQFASLTQNYSGSDITTLIKDAVYEPARRFQSANQFKKLSNGKWTPCREGEIGENKTWLDFEDQNQVDIGQINRQDFLLALQKSKPTVDASQLKEYQHFTRTFGQEG